MTKNEDKVKFVMLDNENLKSKLDYKPVPDIRAEYLAGRRRKSRIALAFAGVLTILLLVGILLSLASFKQWWPFSSGSGQGQFFCKVVVAPHRYIDQHVQVTPDYIALKVRDSYGPSNLYVHVLHLVRERWSVIRSGQTCLFKRSKFPIFTPNATDLAELRDHLKRKHRTIPFKDGGDGKDRISNRVEHVFIKRPRISQAVFRNIVLNLKAHLLCSTADSVFELIDTDPYDECPQDCRQIFEVRSRVRALRPRRPGPPPSNTRFRCKCARQHEATVQDHEILRQLERARAKDVSWQRSPMNSGNSRKSGNLGSRGDSVIVAHSNARQQQRRRQSWEESVAKSRAEKRAERHERPKCSTLNRIQLGMLPKPIDPDQNLFTLHVQDCYGNVRHGRNRVGKV